MTIYCLVMYVEQFDSNYESSEIIAAFTTKDKAIESKNKHNEGVYEFDAIHYEIKEVELC